MWQVTAIHVKMMLWYFVSNNHKVIWVLLVMLDLFWLELTQWLPIYGLCNFISMVLLEQQKIQDRIWYHSCGWLQVAGFYWWEIFRCLCCAITPWKQGGQVSDHCSCFESLSGWTSFH
jgi:hypothetical protein